MGNQMDSNKCMEMGQPGKQHDVLKQFEGTWEAACTFWMQPGEPPMMSKGVMMNTWTLGNRFLKQEYKGEFMPGQMFQGLGFWGFNNASGKYEGIWMDSVSTAIMMDQEGFFDDAGKKFEAVGPFLDPMTRNKIRKKSTIEVNNKDKHTMAMYTEKPGGGWNKCMEIVYTRKK